MCHPDLAVADLARTRRLRDEVDDALHLAVIDHGFEADLRNEVDLVFGAAIGLGMTALTAEATDFTDGHTFDAG